MTRKNIDFKLAKIISAICAVVFFVSFFQASYLIVIKDSHKEDSFSWLETFYYYFFLDWIVIVPIMIVIAAITKQLFKKQLDSKHIILFHFFVSFFIGWLIILFQGIIELIIGRADIDGFKSMISLETTIRYLKSTFLTYLVMLGVIYIYYYIERMKKVEKQKTILSNQLTQSRMKVLKAQLQPHFLFNTLNSIATLVEIDAKQAQNTITDLSDLLREILKSRDNQLIVLKEELIIVEKYIEIIKVRFYDHVEFDINIEANCLDAFVPSMLIQPLIENSIKHGFSEKVNNLKIKISIRQTGKKLNIVISNNGKLLDADRKDILKRGVGLQNTISRLETVFENKFMFDIYNKRDKVFVKISLPFEI